MICWTQTREFIESEVLMKKSIVVLLLTLALAVAPVASLPVNVNAALSEEQKTNRSGANAYARWASNSANKILNAGPKKSVTISTKVYTSLPKNVYDALVERPDVTLTVKWMLGETEFKFRIPRGTDVSKVFDENGYASMAYLQEFFGEKGDTPQAKAIKTVSFKEAAAAAEARVTANLQENVDAVAAKLVQDLTAQYIAAGFAPEQAVLQAQAALPGLLDDLGISLDEDDDDDTDVVASASAAALNAAAAAAAAPAAPAAAPKAAAAAAPATGAQAELIAQQAYAAYVASGMTSDQAFAAVQANLPALLAQAGLGAPAAAPAAPAAAPAAAAPAPAAPAAPMTVDQLIWQTFAQYVAQGLSQQDALAATQAALPALLQQAGLQ